MIEILRASPELVNTSRPGSNSLYAPMHQAARGGSPVEIVEELVAAGAWRTLQNARGERPCDVAEKRGHRHLLGALEPVLRRRVPTGVLLKIQAHFHAVIRDRAANEVEAAGVLTADLRLPELEPFLELDDENAWFPVPGMYGGFLYRLHSDGIDAVLIYENWCRLVDGSGQRHTMLRFDLDDRQTLDLYFGWFCCRVAELLGMSDPDALALVAHTDDGEGRQILTLKPSIVAALDSAKRGRKASG